MNYVVRCAVLLSMFASLQGVPVAISDAYAGAVANSPEVQDISDKHTAQIILKYDLKTGTIIHESFPVDIFERFADDVLYLLPIDMVSVIAKHNDLFVERSKFSVSHDYWRQLMSPAAFSRQSLKDRCDNVVAAIKSNDEETVVLELASMVKPIFEIANLDAHDLTGKKMERRLDSFLTANSNEYVINYRGYGKEPTSKIITRLLSLGKDNKNDAASYQQLVATTAELWSSLWRRSVPAFTATPPQQFLVTSKTFDLKPVLDLRPTIKDYDEFAIVINMQEDWRHQLLAKRMGEYANESEKYNLAERDSAFAKKMSGIKEPRLLYSGTDRTKAVRYQQDYFATMTAEQ